uniref:BTB domain-containing protein n=1 Tax=Rhabditophanes sp. KR3021 TaxID=114890 RepID=A0AC35TT89_9BILA
MALRHFGVEEYYVEAIKELYDNSKLTFSRLGDEVIIPSAADVKQGDCPSPRLFTLLTKISTSIRCPSYEELAQSNPFANAELILADGKTKVSKIVLCYYSNYFYDLFMNDPTKDKFEIPEIELEHLKCYIEVMQKVETFVLDGEFVFKLATIQKELQSPYLESLIVNWLDNNLKKSYLPIIYEAVCNILSQLLRQKTKKLIQDNFKELCTISSYVSFSYDNLNELFDNEFMQTQGQKDSLEIEIVVVQRDKEAFLTARLKHTSAATTNSECCDSETQSVSSFKNDRSVFSELFNDDYDAKKDTVFEDNCHNATNEEEALINNFGANLHRVE